MFCGAASSEFFPSISAATFTLTSTTDGEINTIAGIGGVGGFSGDAGAASSAQLNAPTAVAVAADGTIYLADTSNRRVRKIFGGIITTLVGDGTVGNTGNGGIGTAAAVDTVDSIALDAAGRNLYIVDSGACVVRRVDVNPLSATNGYVFAFAGTDCGFPDGNGGAATEANLGFPQGVAVAPDGQVYVSDTFFCSIRRVDTSNIIHGFAGSDCASSGDGGPAIDAGFYAHRMSFDAAGNLFLIDTGANSVRRIDAATDVITTVAGGGASTPPSGSPTDVNIGNPTDIAIDGNDLFVSNDLQVYKLDLDDNVISIFAGTGNFGGGGDGGPAIDADFANISGLARRGGDLLIIDPTLNRLRAVTSSPIVDTIAGNGTQGYGGDGGAPLDAALFNPYGIAVAPDGTIYFADTQNFRIRKIDTAGVISTIAGTGLEGNDGANGEPATSVSFSTILTIALDPSTGFLYICDVFANRILRIDLAAGTIHHFAGTGIPEYSDGPVVSAGVAVPEGIAVGPDGSLFIADTGNCRIRRVTGGIMTTIAGSNVCESLGDGGLATSASLRVPRRVHVSANGDVYVQDASILNNHDDRVRRIDASTGLIDTVAGGGATEPGFGPATDMDIGNVSDIKDDGLGRLYISSLTRVFRVDLASGILSPYAGTGVEGFSGDGGPAIDATFYGITALAFLDEALIISDGQNNRLRAVNFTPTQGPCGNVTGDLIVVATAVPTIDFGCVTGVTGDLIVSDNASATAISFNSITTVGGNLILSNNTAVGELDLGLLTSAGSVEVTGNTASTVLDLGSLETVSGDLTVSDNGDGVINLNSLASVSGDLTLDIAGSGNLDITGATVSGDVDLDLIGYGGVSGNTAGGSTAVSSSIGEAVMTTQLPQGAFAAPSSFTITRLDPATLPPESGTGPEGAALIDPVAAYQFTFSVPTLNQSASLTFDIILDKLDQATRDALLEALANGQATLATLGDAPGSTYQAFPLCSGLDLPTPDGCVLVQMLDANGQLTAGTPAIVRFSNVVGHFSTWAVAIVSPDDPGTIFQDGFED